jgi:molybdopterin/thiamine biosynthesis adenylyltransferase
MDIDYLRQLNILNPKDFGDRRVTVVGAGATGSFVVSLLAQIGIKNISVWDFDIVEEHNLPNQIYTIKQIGLPKVEALKELIREKSGIEIEIHNERVVDQIKNPGSYFFLLTDTMASRKEIFENCLKGRAFNTDLVIETRMDADCGRVFAFNPNSPNQVKEWQDTLYTDEEATTSLCGASVSIAPTVSLLASLAVWKLIHQFDVAHGPNHTKSKGKEEPIYNETTFQLGPEEIMNRRFKII